MAGPVLRLEVDGIDELSRHFAHLPGVVAKAEYRAFKRTSDWAKSQGAKSMSRESRLTQKVLKARHRAQAYQSDGFARVWFGVDPIKAVYTGKLKQQKRGIKVGKFTFKGAFVATMKSGHTGIFMRQGKSRLPIIEQFINVILPEEEFNRIAQESESKLLNQFHHELEYYAGKLNG